MIVAKASNSTRALVIGASFIGLEAWASLRKRGIEVDVVAPDTLRLERVMGAAIGRFVQGIHESKLVRVLTYHVVPGKVMAADVVKISSAKALAVTR